MSARKLLAAFSILLIASGCSFALSPGNLAVKTISLGGSGIQVSSDSLQYDTDLKELIVGGDQAGNLVLYHPDTLTVKAVPISAQPNSPAGKPRKVVSAIVAHNVIYAVDAESKSLLAIDPNNGNTLSSVPVKSTPEYIRIIPAKNELWVTEPDDEQIEVFSLADTGSPGPSPAGLIPVPNGPVGLVIDNERGLAYTNQSTSGTTAVIQLQTHGIIAEWGNGCSEGRGMALDPEHGMLFIACKEGKVVMLNTAEDGKQVASQAYGGNLEEVAYNPKLHHLYLPSGASSILAVFGVEVAPASSTTPAGIPTSAPGGPAAITIRLTRLGTADTAMNANCAATDGDQNIWVCDPLKAQIYLITDTFPANSQGW